MDSVRKEFKHLESSGDFQAFLPGIDELLATLTKARNTIESVPLSRREQLGIVRNSVTGWTTKVSKTQKDIYGSLSKYGKALDKKFKTDIEAAYNNNAFPTTSLKHLNKAITMHLIREGEFTVADRLAGEADVQIAPSLEAGFKEMYEILHEIRRRNLKPAIDWAVRYRTELLKWGSNIEFNLHSLQFIHYFTMVQRDGQPVDGHLLALQYARENFASFGEKYLPEISKLMCAFLFKSNLEKSPYASLFLAAPAWEEAEKSFTKEFCTLMGLSSDSPLHLTASAGAIALPTLLKMGTIMKEKHTEWSSENELPVETPLPDSFQFHAIFVCPVSKEQTTDENPPMKMPCGHIIAKESLSRMSRNNPNQRFKCPYCPNESIPNEAIRVYF
ncbi:CTLH/CRA C-terminal to lish motif domain-containing protein [Lipomyces oligophaga]|uniref:CTLH/CRA C-terminal to lish motif domain-containing protein n=1 Tax=Lipomyces oligophaga TaxID=45792 RepID=UPI0034CEDF22